MKIHDWMDSSKAVIGLNCHRAVYHNSFAIYHIIPAIFGDTFVNSVGRTVSTKDVAELHCLEDFGGVIPTLQDWLEGIPMAPWMSGIGKPPSAMQIPKDSEVQFTVD